MDLRAPILYDDKDVKIRQSGITIKNYYFPFATSKRIPLDNIIDVHLINDKVDKLWGTDELKYWFALDKDRQRRRSYILIDNGSSIKPAFTCLSSNKVYNILKILLRKRQKQLSMPLNDQL